MKNKLFIYLGLYFVYIRKHIVKNGTMISFIFFNGNDFLLRFYIKLISIVHYNTFRYEKFLV